MKESLLPRSVHEVVEGRHLEAGVEQMLAKDATEVTKTSGDEDALCHRLLQQDYGSSGIRTTVRAVATRSGPA